jgi:hypothetical protein
VLEYSIFAILAEMMFFTRGENVMSKVTRFTVILGSIMLLFGIALIYKYNMNFFLGFVTEIILIFPVIFFYFFHVIKKWAWAFSGFVGNISILIITIFFYSILIKFDIYRVDEYIFRSVLGLSLCGGLFIILYDRFINVRAKKV